MSQVRVERDEERGVALVVLNRPQKLNALSPGLITEARAALVGLRYDRGVRAIVIAGEGAGFCAGFDLGSGEDLPPDAEGRSRLGRTWRTQQDVAGLIVEIYEHPKPIVSAVHGAAVGGGLAIALASDLRVASASAKFSSAFIKVGLSSCDVGVSYLFPRIVGLTRATELMLTGRQFSGTEAMEFGMLNVLAPDGAHLERAVELATSVASIHEFGLEMTKSGLHAALDAPSLRHAIEMENRTQALGTFGANASEAVRAFGQGRPPAWTDM